MLVRDAGNPLIGGLLATVFVLWVANFLVFGAVSVMIGGDALNGHSDGAHYFLDQHGKLTEVSRSVFQYSRTHELLTLVTLPIAILCWLILWLRQGAQRETTGL